MKFTIRHYYEADDVRFIRDSYDMLLDENGNVVKEGDEYHDKISSWTEGFLDGLRYAGIEVVVAKERLNDAKGEIF